MHARLGMNKKKTRERPNRNKPKRPKPVPGEKLVGPRDPKDLMPELITSNILKKLPEENISSFVGDYNYLRSLKEKQDILQPDPSLAQLRQLCSEFIAIP